MVFVFGLLQVSQESSFNAFSASSLEEQNPNLLGVREFRQIPYANELANIRANFEICPDAHRPFAINGRVKRPSTSNHDLIRNSRSRSASRWSPVVAFPSEQISVSQTRSVFSDSTIDSTWQVK